MNIFTGEVKIKTDLSNNFFDIYNEARGIAMNRKRILKKKKNIPLHYINFIFYSFIIIFVLSLIMLLQHYSLLFVRYALFIIILDLLFYFYGLFRIYINYWCKRKNNFISTVLINKKGITDLSSFKNIEILFKWDRVDAVVVGDLSVVILFKRGIYLYFDIRDKKKIIDGIKRFKRSILIIE